MSFLRAIVSKQTCALGAAQTGTYAGCLKKGKGYIAFSPGAERDHSLMLACEEVTLFVLAV